MVRVDEDTSRPRTPTCRLIWCFPHLVRRGNTLGRTPRIRSSGLGSARIFSKRSARTLAIMRRRTTGFRFDLADAQVGQVVTRRVAVLVVDV